MAEEVREILERLQAHVPFLKEMIDNRLKSDMPQYAKIVALHAMITDKRRKFKFETLKKCEEVIIKMQTKTLLSQNYRARASQADRPTIRSPSPMREVVLENKSDSIPTIRSPDPESWNSSEDTSYSFQGDRYTNERPSVYSSAAESISKPKSIFERLGTIIPEPDISKPPISMADLALLQSDDIVSTSFQEETKEVKTDFRTHSKVSLVPAPIIKPKHKKDKLLIKLPEAKSKPRVEKIVKDADSTFGNLLSSIDDQIMVDKTKKRRDSKDGKKEEKRHDKKEKDTFKPIKISLITKDKVKNPVKEEEEVIEKITKDMLKPIPVTVKPKPIEIPEDKPQDKVYKRIADKYNPKPRKRVVDQPNIDLVDEILKGMQKTDEIKIPFLGEAESPKSEIRFQPPPTLSPEPFLADKKPIKVDPRIQNQNFNKIDNPANRYSPPSPLMEPHFNNKMNFIPNQSPTPGFQNPRPNFQNFQNNFQPRPIYNDSRNFIPQPFNNFGNKPQFMRQPNNLPPPRPFTPFEPINNEYDMGAPVDFYPPANRTPNPYAEQNNYPPNQHFQNKRGGFHQNNYNNYNRGRDNEQYSSYKSWREERESRDPRLSRRDENRCEDRFSRAKSRDRFANRSPSPENTYHGGRAKSVCRETREETKSPYPRDRIDKRQSPDRERSRGRSRAKSVSRDSKSPTRSKSRTKYDDVYSRKERRSSFQSPLDSLYPQKPEAILKASLQNFKIPKKNKLEEQQQDSSDSSQEEAAQVVADSTCVIQEELKETVKIEEPQEVESQVEVEPETTTPEVEAEKEPEKEKEVKPELDITALAQNEAVLNLLKQNAAATSQPQITNFIAAFSEMFKVLLAGKDPANLLTEALASTSKKVEEEPKKVEAVVKEETSKKVKKDESPIKTRQKAKAEKEEVPEDSKSEESDEAEDDLDDEEEEEDEEIKPKKLGKPKNKPKQQKKKVVVKKKPKPKPKPLSKKETLIESSVGERIKNRKRKTVVTTNRKPRRSELDKLHEDIKETLGDEMLATSTKRTCTIHKDEHESKPQEEPVAVIAPEIVVEKDKTLRVVLQKLDIKKPKRKATAEPPIDLAPLPKRKSMTKAVQAIASLVTDAEKADAAEKRKDAERLKELELEEEKVEEAEAEAVVEKVEEKKPEISKDVEAPGSPNKRLLKKKRRSNGWAAGVIKKKKKLNKKDSDDEEEEIEEKEDASFVEPDKDYYLKFGTLNHCKLCNFKGTGIVYHYMMMHPDNDIWISRLSPEATKQAVDDAEKQKLDEIEVVPDNSKVRKRNKYDFKCRFCLNDLKDQTALYFYDHVTSHTGEFRFKCTFCHFRNNNKKNLKTHIQMRHEKEGADKINEVTAETPPPNFHLIFAYVCTECNFLQLKKEAVLEHIQIYHLGDSATAKKISMSLTVDKEEKIEDKDEPAVVNTAETTEEEIKNTVDETEDKVVEPEIEEPPQNADMTVFMCDAEIALDDSNHKEEQLKKMKEIQESIKTNRTTFANKLQSRLDSAAEEQAVEKPPAEEPVQQDDTPAPSTPRLSKPKAVVEPSIMKVTMTPKANPIGNTVNRLQDQLNNVLESKASESDESESNEIGGDENIEATEPEPAVATIVAVTKAPITEAQTIKAPAAKVETIKKAPKAEAPKAAASTALASKAEALKAKAPLTPKEEVEEEPHKETFKEAKLLVKPEWQTKVETKVLKVATVEATLEFCKSPVFVCKAADCIFQTKERNIFEAHCNLTHKSQMTLVSCYSCDDKRNMSMLSVFQHLCLHVDEELKEFERLKQEMEEEMKKKEEEMKQKEEEELKKKEGLKQTEDEKKVPEQEEEDDIVIDLLDDDEETSNTHLTQIKISNVTSLAPKKDLPSLTTVPPLIPLKSLDNTATIILNDPAIFKVVAQSLSAVPRLPMTSSTGTLTCKVIPMTPEEMQKTRKKPSIVEKWLQPDILEHLLKCPQYSCTFTTNEEQTFDQHIEAHNFVSHVYCLYCNFKMKSEFIKVHLMMRHVMCEYGCAYCLYRAVIPDYIQIHQEVAHKGRPIKTVKFRPMTNTIKYKPPAYPKLQNILQPYICRCKKRYYVIDSFEKHIQTCPNAKINHLYICKECGEAAKYPRLLTQHYMKHGIHEYHCRFCVFGGPQTLGLLQHIALTHSHQKPSIICRQPQDLISEDHGTGILDNLTIITPGEGSCSVPIAAPVMSVASIFPIATTAASPVIAIATPTVKSVVSPVKSVAISPVISVASPTIASPKIASPVTASSTSPVATISSPPPPTTPTSLEQRSATLEQRPTSPEDFDDSMDVLEDFGLESDTTGKKTDLSGGDLYKCNTCKEPIYDSLSLKSHLIRCTVVADKGRPFVCVHCNKSFKTATNLVDHIRIHGTKRFGCSLCSYKHAHPWHLRTHMKAKHKITNCTIVPLNPAKKNMDTDEFLARPGSRRSSLADAPTKDAPGNPSTAEPARKLHFSPSEIEQLPMRPIYSYDVFCSICNFATKVRMNLVRHMGLHNNNETVSIPMAAPVNPVPCLEKNELMFDKMTNLAMSSHAGGRMGGRMGGPPQNKEETLDFNAPVFVPINKRYVCGANNCNYLCLEESMLKHHLQALHMLEKTYICSHCNADLSNEKSSINLESIIKHLRLHDSSLYKCGHCKFLNNNKGKVERHCGEKHSEKPLKFLTVREILEGDGEEKEKRNRPWRCGMCKGKFTNKNEVVAHVETKHCITSRYKCSYCDFKSDDKSTFNDHFEAVHQGFKQDIIVVYYEQEDAKIEPEIIEHFDTTPLWVKNKTNQIKHIRGILLEEQEKVTKKSPIKLGPMPTPSPEKKTPAKSNLDLAIEAVASGTSTLDVSKRPPKRGRYKSQQPEPLTPEVPFEFISVENNDAPDSPPVLFKEERPEVPAGIIEIVDSPVTKKSKPNDSRDPSYKQLTSMTIKELMAGNFMGTYGPYGKPNENKFLCPLCARYQHKYVGTFEGHLCEELQYLRFKCKSCDHKASTYTKLNRHREFVHGQDAVNGKVECTPPNQQIDMWIRKVIVYQERLINHFNTTVEKKAPEAASTSADPTGSPPSTPSAPFEGAEGIDDLSLLSMSMDEPLLIPMSTEILKPEKVKIPKTKSLLNCTTCSFKCTTKAAMKNHMEKEHPGLKPESPSARFYCDICSSVFLKTWSMKIHKRKKHGIIEGETPPPKLTARKSTTTVVKATARKSTTQRALPEESVSYYKSPPDVTEEELSRIKTTVPVMNNFLTMNVTQLSKLFDLFPTVDVVDCKENT